MNWKKLTTVILACLLLALMLAGCAQSNQAVGTAGSDGTAGFGSGLWHGFILPVSFIISLFDDSVGIYEIHNNGNLYNLGFVLGTWFVFSVLLASQKNAGRR